jgi:hypothetical protein
MDKIRARVDKVCTVKDEFWGQWNRVVEYVLIYEEILGEDPEVLILISAKKLKYSTYKDSSGKSKFFKRL